MTWFDRVIAKQILGLLFRRLLVVVGTLLMAGSCLGTDVCHSLAEWLDVNSDQIVEFAIGAVFLLVSIVLSYIQKVRERSQIKRLGGF